MLKKYIIKNSKIEEENSLSPEQAGILLFVNPSQEEQKYLIDIDKDLINKKKQIIEEEENREIVAPNTHYVEIISPTIAYIAAIASFFGKFWYTAYFGIIFACIGIYICKKRNGFLNKGVLLYNILAFALCMILGGLWVCLYVGKLAG